VKSINVKNEKIMKLELCHFIKKGPTPKSYPKNAYIRKRTRKNQRKMQKGVIKGVEVVTLSRATS
jgi:hypothetical protein